jgi:nitroimidazol reductase NimA-like FMN-containing flavoprotein (pyridoxamine 5'-phosphate oxidase superfamily)
MNLEDNWAQIKIAFDSGIKSSRYCAIGTVSPDGYPHVTPIGFIFLRDDYTAFYFEEYTKKIPQNVERNPRVCLMLVNRGGLFWFASLYKGRFDSPPGIRLLGVAGERRAATDQEKAAYRARVKPFRRLKGYDLIWKDLNHVREIKLERFEPVVYPKMTDHLWR